MFARSIETFREGSGKNTAVLLDFDHISSPLLLPPIWTT